MQHICPLSRRWHQQFSRSASLVGHQRCLQQLQPARHYRQVVRGKRDSASVRARPTSDLVVREYEQFGSDPRTRVSVDRRADEEVENNLQQRIQELEHELAVLRQGPFGRDSELMQSLPHDEREELLKTLEKEGVLSQQGDDLINPLDLESLLGEDDDVEQGAHSEVPSVTMRIPMRQKAYVKQFNKALEGAVEPSQDAQAQLQLWKWYLRCQQHVADFSSVVSEDVWRLLWISQTSTIRRPKQIIVLARDMLLAKVALEGPQWVTYIEALADDGDVATALKTWEQQKLVAGVDATAAADFWSLGVRLCADLGKPQEAQTIALECLTYSSAISPRILIRVISAWARSKHPSAGIKAWTMYLGLRTELGDQIDMDIYDSVSTALLQAGRSDLAVAVFKDMMLSDKTSSDDSQSFYDQAIARFQNPQQKAVSEDQINQISLASLTSLPKRYLNKFFFGSWIKRLIGQGDVDGASSVVELMYERGIKLDAKHLSGLIGAWLRQGTPTAQRKAERMAWTMINARVELVKSRSIMIGENKSSIRRTFPTKLHQEVPLFLQRAAPAATVETFSILLQYYTRRMDMASANQVTNVMTGPAQIIPNAFIMNHWLYAALRSSDLQGVWDKYSGLKDDIAPDLETFAALWDTAKVQYDPSRAAHAKRFPSGRVLFAEMVNWLQSLPERKSEAINGDFSRELYDQIIRCFCLSSDMPGTLCAVYGLKDLFGLFPDESTLRMCMIQVARLLPLSPNYQVTGRRGSKRKLYQQKDALNLVTGIVDNITEAHGLELFGKGIDIGSLEESSDTAMELRLAILTEFLLKIMETVQKEGGDVKNEVWNVAKVMHVDLPEF